MIAGAFSVVTQFTVATVREWTLERHAIGHTHARVSPPATVGISIAGRSCKIKFERTSTVPPGGGGSRRRPVLRYRSHVVCLQCLDGIYSVNQ